MTCLGLELIGWFVVVMGFQGKAMRMLQVVCHLGSYVFADGSHRTAWPTANSLVAQLTSLLKVLLLGGSWLLAPKQR